MDDTKLVITLDNRHADGCGEPPRINAADSPQMYYGYYENIHGEQWVFQFDHESRTAILYGGDIGWDNPITIETGKPVDIIMGAGGQVWLQVCWQTANERLGDDVKPLIFPDLAKMLGR